MDADETPCEILTARMCMQVQSRIQRELDTKVGDHRPPQLADRGSLPYLEATIREVLRIRPVAPLLIPHVALCDTRYQVHQSFTQTSHNTADTRRA